MYPKVIINDSVYKICSTVDSDPAKSTFCNIEIPDRGNLINTVVMKTFGTILRKSDKNNIETH